MRLRFSLNIWSRYAFVQKDETDGKDYPHRTGRPHPLAGDRAQASTGTRYHPVDGDGIRLLSPVILQGLRFDGKNYEAHAQFMRTRPATWKSPTRRKTGDLLTKPFTLR